MLFTEGARRAGKNLTRDALVSALESVKGWDSGILPPVTFTPNSHLGVTSFFKMVAHKGQWAATGELVDSQAMNW